LASAPLQPIFSSKTNEGNVADLVRLMVDVGAVKQSDTRIQSEIEEERDTPSKSIRAGKAARGSEDDNDWD